ncbi:hypothetical protein GCM10010988_40500 [Cnuibacter physcomitrellae]|uniref:Uncharacterized protein n=1 Tax=Cnuibacter physcomitrellae TaxID=1619308 RepID=A0A1X9LR21_9MICO|nr:hypothetical protein [Cnuibacter physcomitrellae]ARJ07633.1 hypothetical protein B5808_19845 [Cnuibacter physcomitrellae]GGI42730.1 hypothetical protein GCM10010988_40500 [Cnuibacter physcomitrellae]
MDEDYRRYPGAVSDGLYRGLRTAGLIGLIVFAAGSVLQLALTYGAGIETPSWAMAPQWIGITLFLTTSIIQSIDDRQRYKAMLEAAASAERARRNPLAFLLPSRSR